MQKLGRWLGKAAATAGRDGAVNCLHLCTVEKQLECEGGEKTRKSKGEGKENGWGINSKDGRCRKFGTPVRGEVLQLSVPWGRGVCSFFHPEEFFFACAYVHLISDVMAKNVSVLIWPKPSPFYIGSDSEYMYISIICSIITTFPATWALHFKAH